jgi:hypothetical protein
MTSICHHGITRPSHVTTIAREAHRESKAVARPGAEDQEPQTVHGLVNHHGEKEDGHDEDQRPWTAVGRYRVTVGRRQPEADGSGTDDQPREGYEHSEHGTNALEVT